MSLKAFHVFFIFVSILTAVGFGIWCVLAYGNQAGTLYLLSAVASFGLAVGLFFYGSWFLRKLAGIRTT